MGDEESAGSWEHWGFWGWGIFTAGTGTVQLCALLEGTFQIMESRHQPSTTTVFSSVPQEPHPLLFEMLPGTVTPHCPRAAVPGLHSPSQNTE